MDTITTTIKREYFAAIVDGSKRIEYRKIKPYWTKKLAKVETPFRLVLRNGMRVPVPVVTVRIDKILPSPEGGGGEAAGVVDATVSGSHDQRPRCRACRSDEGIAAVGEWDDAHQISISRRNRGGNN